MITSQAKKIVEDAITNRKILNMVYKHSSDGEIVDHVIAPLDIGTTSPATRKRFENTLFAYSYTHLNKEGKPDPRQCPFNIAGIIELEDSGKTFNPVQITDLNKRATGYDYRNCEFAVLPNRDWYD